MLISELLGESKDKKKKKTIAQVSPSQPNSYSIEVHVSSALVRDTRNDPDLQAGVKAFVSSKIAKLKILDARKEVVTPQSMQLAQDRGSIYGLNRKYQHCHLTLPQGDKRAHDISIFYYQEIDRAAKKVDLYLGRVVGHKVYDSYRQVGSLGSSLDSAVYQPVPVA